MDVKHVAFKWKDSQMFDGVLDKSKPFIRIPRLRSNQTNHLLINHAVVIFLTIIYTV